MRTAGGERYVQATDVQPLTSGWPVTAERYEIGLQSVGGGDWYCNQAGAGGQRGICGACGCCNIGLPVRTVGRSTSAGPHVFTLTDCIGTPGVWATVPLPDDAPVPPNGSIVVLTGISSCAPDAGDPSKLRRVIRVRRAEDVVVLR